MLKILSMLNFKKIPYAFALSVSIVCVCEIYMKDNFRDIFFNHEVDFVVSIIENKKFDKEYIIIGDSVGLQLTQGYQDRFSVLATNQAIETAGQYFLIKRYLEKNSIPKAVIFIALPFFDNDLNQVYTENFILRVFNRPDEIFDIFTSQKDVTMAVKMLIYNFLFSYKNKLQIQKKILGYTNADIYSGNDNALPELKYEDYSLIKIVNKFNKKRRERMSVKSSDVFFEKLVAFLQEKNINIYYIPAPISEDNSYEEKEYRKMFSLKLPVLAHKYSNFYYIYNYEKYKKNMFVDGVHLTQDGLVVSGQHIKDKFFLITEKEMSK
ncbi:MAG: hypothetical protein ACTFAK_04305 [Candidatus Electronema sp. VV]